MRIAIVILALCIGIDASDRFVASFRLLKEPRTPRSGWVVCPDDTGFSFERFAGGRAKVAWTDVVEEDRRILRRKAGLDPQVERVLRIPGHRLHLEGGNKAEGVLVSIDKDRRHYLRRDGFLFAYDEDRVKRVEEIEVDETAVYSADELYARRLRRQPPSTAGEHRGLADHLLDLGMFDLARKHYEKALKMRPALRGAIERQLAELDALGADALVGKQLQRVRRKYRIQRDFDGARDAVREFSKKHPDRERVAIQMMEEIEKYRQTELQRLFTRVKHETVDRAIRSYLLRQPDIAEARSWITSTLADVVRARMKERLDLTDAEYDELRKAPKTGAPHWATYHHGSWIISKRAKIGKRTKKQTRGDPDRWWAAYSDSQTRGGWLRAYAAERVPELFEVVMVKLSDCGRCGGRGQLTHQSLKGNKNLSGGHSWKDTCPLCFGAKKQRSVQFR